jgi:hypothetical protein
MHVEKPHEQKKRRGATVASNIGSVWRRKTASFDSRRDSFAIATIRVAARPPCRIENGI